MDEERLQSYLNVINQLLTCENGQEPDILRRNQALIDASLVQAMERVAGVLTQRGDSQQAEWLRQLANQLELGLASPPRLEKTEDRLVYRQVRSFEERFGKPHLYLAYHAAFPLALTPDLLYKIWANFQRDIEDKLLNIPWEAVADVLLSGLCKEVGGEELYEMDLAVRNVLLNELKANHRFGEERLKNLSEFVLEYIQEQIHSDDSNIRDFAQVQKWTALAYTKPDKAARELALALREKLQQQNKAELVRMASVVETLAEPLVGFEPLLVYSRGMGKLARGDNEEAFVKFRELGELGDWIRVKGVSLPVPSESYVDKNGAIQNFSSSFVHHNISQLSKPSYLNLIQLLLNCPQGKEAEIIKAHQNIVDTDLVETMKQIAAMLIEQGEQKAAEFLIYIAHKLVEAMTSSLQANDIQQAKVDFNSDPASKLEHQQQENVDTPATQANNIEYLEVDEQLTGQLNEPNEVELARDNSPQWLSWLQKFMPTRKRTIEPLELPNYEDIRIIGDRGAGRTTYMAALAYWPNVDINSIIKSVLPLNEKTNELISPARDLLTQGLLSLTPILVDNFDKLPLYSILIELKPRFFQQIVPYIKADNIKIKVSIRDYPGDFTDLIYTFSSDKLLSDYLDDCASASSLMLLIDGTSSGDRIYARAFEILSRELRIRLEANKIKLSSYRIAVVFSKCEQASVWIYRDNLSKLIKLRFPLIQRTLKEWSRCCGSQT